MQTCDVLIGGGGPAGSACAWKLRQAGLDVLVVDRATFPREKPCAGWITPQVVGDLALDVDEYQRGRTLQPITGFRIGVIGGNVDVTVPYNRVVSYGIRRAEFDHYLLLRSRARLQLGTPIASIRRDAGDWIVNDAIRTPMLVGAGGHFCAVAAWLNGPASHDRLMPLVLAQEAEFPVDAHEASFATAPDTPEFYFSADLSGYGWCCRKQRYVNVGFGHLAGRGALPDNTDEFVGFLARRKRVPLDRRWRWHGHAYLLRDGCARRLAAPGIVLVGDAAGMADPHSGEGIRPAIESGLLAAKAIVDAKGHYDDLRTYETRLRARFGRPVASPRARRTAMAGLGRGLLGVPWFVRRVVLDRWFLHAREPALDV